MGSSTDTISYGYGSTIWGDLLTSYDGTTITYDTIGNPLNDGIWAYTWTQGRQLASMASTTSGSNTWNFSYDANGLRTGRNNGSTEYYYVYNESGQLTQINYGSLILNLAYDAEGRPVSISYNGNIYYFILNLQGDVVALVDSAGNQVVGYTYDAWGKLLEAAEAGRPPRSLTVDAQLTIFRELTSDYKQSGDRMALLLMLFCGVRNSEACGICFQDVYKRPDCPGTYVLVLPNSVCLNHIYAVGQNAQCAQNHPDF